MADNAKIVTTWGDVRTIGSKIANLAGKGGVVFVTKDNTEIRPHRDTVVQIDSGIAELIESFEEAVAAMKTAYTA